MNLAKTEIFSGFQIITLRFVLFQAHIRNHGEQVIPTGTRTNSLLHHFATLNT